jgi:hypothetical protein
MQIGDEIFLLLEVDIVDVLKPMEGGYKLVGGCYAHGSMYGKGSDSDRRPPNCCFPGSSEATEFWPTDWSAWKGKGEEAERSPEWHIIQADESDTHEDFEERLPDVVGDGLDVVPSWDPPWTTLGEAFWWLFKRGFNLTVPIFTTDFVIV